MSETRRALPRQFTTTLGRDDFAAAAMRFGSGPDSLWPVMGLALIGDLALLFLLPDTLGDLAVVGAVTAVTVAAFAIVHVARRWRLERRIARWTPPGRQQVTASLAGVVTIENGVERSDAWDALAHVALDEARLYLVRGPGDVIVLPMRAFADAADMADFYGLARRLMAGADDDEPDAAAAPPRSQSGAGS